MLISVFTNERDNIPSRLDITWEQLIERLSHVQAATCKIATCARAQCPYKRNRAWSPASWPDGETRRKQTVESISALVFDLDHIAPTELDRLLDRVAEYTYILHSSHSDRADDRCIRLVLQISRAVAGCDYAAFRRAAVAYLQLPVDPSTHDASRLYYAPTRPSDGCADVFDGSGFDFASNTGCPLDVDALAVIPEPETASAPLQEPKAPPGGEGLTRAAEILGHAWPSSGRHQAQLALSGALTRAGWSIDLVAEFCAMVAEVQEPGNRSPEKRLSTARSSADKLASGEPICGWPTVEQFVGHEVVHEALRALGLGVTPDPEFVSAMTALVYRAHAPSRLEVRAALEHQRDRWKRSKDLQKRLDAKLLTKILKSEALTDHADEDRQTALVHAAMAVARAAPTGALPETLCEFLFVPAGRLAGDVEKVVRLALARVTQAPSDAQELPDPIDDAQLRSQLELDKEGHTRASGANIERILRFATELRDTLRFNVITKQVEVTTGRFQDETPNSLPVGLKNWLGSHWQLSTSTMEVADQLLRVAQKWSAYDPVAEYLGELQWDGKGRIGGAKEPSWLTTYCGVTDSSYTRKVGARFLISAVARGLSPGCKVDTVLVLEGDQGARKSTTLSILGGQWFTDTPMILGDKDSRLLAASKWIVELGELKSLLRDDEASKGFLSQRHDDFRPPYGRAPEQFLRRCVFAGSTNEWEYLQDPTGNRRYWAVRVGRCDVEALARDRDQLWAEAVYRYLHADLHPDQADAACPGERWWFLDIEQAEADEVIAQRCAEDPWVAMIVSWTAHQSRQIGTQPPKSFFTMPEIGEHALRLPSSDMQRYSKKISQAMRSAGFEPQLVSGPDGQRRRVWVRRLPIPTGPQIVYDAARN